MDTLLYWLNRLYPLIKSEDETVVVVANRCGIEPGAIDGIEGEVVKATATVTQTEGVNGGFGVIGAGVESGGCVGSRPANEEARYAGSSCVLVFGKGRAKVLGVEGKGVEGVLRVDTRKEEVDMVFGLR